MMMESGFSSPRNETLPHGLRVLVVDDDLAWLKILERMLKKCSYEVTTCGLAREALKLLRERKDGFDIIISDVNMPDMDGFKLLEHIGLEMDLPVIMMSVDGETSRVMKGVQHGACDYLLKPIGMKELKNIWQHVWRKRRHEVREVDCEDRNGTDSSNNGHYGADQVLLRKRKEIHHKHDEKESSDSSSMKKARVVWTVELHKKFVNAVNQIGIDSDKIGPKKILDLMKVPWLTRENVASHLQKYRLYLSRMPKVDVSESSCRVVQNSDHSPKDSSGSLSGTNNAKQQNDVSSNCVYPRNQLPVGAMGTMPLVTDRKSSNLLPLNKEQPPMNGDQSDPRKASTSFVLPDTDMNVGSLDSPLSGCYPWTANLSGMHYKTGFESHFSLDGCFGQPTLPVLQQPIGDETLASPPCIESGLSISKSDNIGLIDSNNDTEPLFPIERAIESFSVSNPEENRCVFDVSLDINNQNVSLRTSSVSPINEQTLLEGSVHTYPFHPESPLSNQQVLESNIVPSSSQSDNFISQGSMIGLDSEQNVWWLQGGDVLSNGLGLDCIGLSDFNYPQHFGEVHLPKFGLDYDVFDCMEFPVDQRLLLS